MISHETVIEGLAPQAVPPEQLPFILISDKMVREGSDHVIMVFPSANNTTNLRNGGIIPQKLNHPDRVAGENRTSSAAPPRQAGPGILYGVKMKRIAEFNIPPLEVFPPQPHP